MARILAAADIGSNTVHVLVAATDGQLVTRIDNLSEWIPLGEAVARSGYISNDRIEQLVQAIKECRRAANARKAEAFTIFATEAMRSARNHDAVLQKLEAETGVKVHLISPKREAELSFKGTQLDIEGHSTELFFEVGGGSAQVAVIREGKVDQHVSLPIGTGKVIAHSGLRNPCPPECLRDAEKYIAEMLRSVSLPQVSEPVAVASGGVVRGLWRALHPDGEKSLHKPEIEYLIWAAARMTSDRIGARFGVKQRRAQTLLPGAIVYKALMERLRITELLVSEFGVREGAILEMAASKNGATQA